MISASCISGSTAWFKPRAPFYLRLLPFFLLINLIVELINYYLVVHYKMQTIGIYNIFIVFGDCFYLFILYQIIQNTRTRRIIIWAGIAFVLFAIWNLIFWQTMKVSNNITGALGSLLIVSSSIAYFIEIFRRPKAISLLTEPAFWVCCGLIFFNICTLPFFGMIHLIGNLPEPLVDKIYTANSIVTIFLYLLFSVAFLCRLRIRKSI